LTLLAPEHSLAAGRPGKFPDCIENLEEETFMAQKLGLLFAVLLFSSIPVRAQDKVEVFGGYSYMRFRPSPNTNLNGWEFSGQYKFTDWLGGVADVDGHYGSPAGISTSVYTYLFGPQVSFPARVSPFAHFLLGGAHVSAAGFGNSSFSMAFGAGIDTEVKASVRWRIIQVDYLMTNFAGNTQNNARVSTGIVFRF
jgi:hypothetical protein